MSDPFAHALSRLLPRCGRAGDAAATAGPMTEAVSHRVAHWPVPFTPAMARARIERAREQAATGCSLPMALRRRPADPNRASLGYRPEKARQGRGYMAAPAVVVAGLRLLGVAVIEAAVRPDDPASIAGLPRLGTRREGQRLVHPSARGRDGWCLAYEVARPDA